MNKILKIAAAAAAVVSLHAHANLVIDTFNDGQFVNDHSTADGGGWSQSGPDAGIFGGYREIFVQKTFGGNVSNASLDVSAVAQLGKFAQNTPTGVNGWSVVRWDGAATLGQSDGGNGTFNFNTAAVNTSNVIGNLAANGDTFSFLYTSDHTVTLKIEIWSPSGGYSFIEAPLDNTIVNGQTVEQAGALSLGLLSGNADYSKVTALQVSFNGDHAVTELDLSFASTQVPEPASLALAGLALLGLGLTRRRSV